MTPNRFAESRNSRLWAAVAAAIADLTASEEIAVNTAPDYVIGYICQELIAKKVALAEGPAG